jgi:Hypoxia induced protein conserved region
MQTATSRPHWYINLRGEGNVGAAATCFALLGAARMGYKKNSKGMQYFFRARVAAQAFTILALWAGIYVYEDDRKANNWRAREKAEARAKAKHVDPPLIKNLCRTPG